LSIYQVRAAAAADLDEVVETAASSGVEWSAAQIKEELDKGGGVCTPQTLNPKP
jgi:hypothetical protein